MGNVREGDREAKSNLPLQITFIGWDCQVPPESKKMREGEKEREGET